VSYSGNLPVREVGTPRRFGLVSFSESGYPPGLPPAPASGGTLSRTRSQGPIEHSAHRHAGTSHLEHRSADHNRDRLHDYDALDRRVIVQKRHYSRS